jgi:hypothetical protein
MYRKKEMGMQALCGQASSKIAHLLAIFPPSIIGQ